MWSMLKKSWWHCVSSGGVSLDACWWQSDHASNLLQFLVYRIVADYREDPLKVRHSGRKWPTCVEPSTVVQLEPHVTSSSQESSASNPNELLALLPEHSELASAGPVAESTSWWRCVGVLRHTFIRMFLSRLLMSQHCAFFSAGFWFSIRVFKFNEFKHGKARRPREL